MGNNEVISFPDSRVSTIDVVELGLKKHHIKALLEIDVTRAREIFKEIKAREGQGLSLTAWLVKCISIAVGEHRSAHAFLQSSRSMLVFDDIDISITVEKEYNGSRVPLPYVIRDTGNKSTLDIHNEIRGAQEGIAPEGGIVIGEDYNKLGARFFLALPGFIRRLVWKRFLLKPRQAQKNMGSVMLTSVGMPGSVDAWFIPVSIHPLCFAIGSITKKPGVVDDQVMVREYLKITALIDHDVMDGVPAARFLARLAELLEAAYGLEEFS